MPFVAFQLRLQAGAVRQLTLIGALRAADGGSPKYIESLQQIARVQAPKPAFALIQSVDG